MDDNLTLEAIVNYPILSSYLTGDSENILAELMVCNAEDGEYFDIQGKKYVLLLKNREVDTYQIYTADEIDLYIKVVSPIGFEDISADNIHRLVLTSLVGTFGYIFPKKQTLRQLFQNIVDFDTEPSYRYVFILDVLMSADIEYEKSSALARLMTVGISPDIVRSLNRIFSANLPTPHMQYWVREDIVAALEKLGFADFEVGQN